MGDNQNHFKNNQTRDNTTIGTLNHNMVQDNGTDSQEKPINNSNLSKRIWSEREIEKLIAINAEERLKKYGFMERLKKIWDEEFLEKTHCIAKGLRNNASRFKKRKKGSKNLQNPPQIIEQPNKEGKIKWRNEKKVKLVQLEEQAKNGGIGSMERLKRVWGECYPEFIHLPMQCLQDNAGRFKKDKTIKNLTLVRNREVVAEQLI